MKTTLPFGDQEMRWVGNGKSELGPGKDELSVEFMEVEVGQSAGHVNRHLGKQARVRRIHWSFSLENCLRLGFLEADPEM